MGRRHALVAVGAAALLASCVFPHRMQRAGPAGQACPTTFERPAVAAPPDTTVIRWYRSSDDRSVTRGARGCEAVGAPLLRQDPAGGFPPFSVGDSLVILSWSADGAGGDLEGLLRGELGVRCDGPESGPGPAAPAFVVLAQDVLRARAGSDPTRGDTPGTVGVAEVARRCGLALHFVASRVEGRYWERGNAVLSSLPITIPVAIELPVEVRRAVAVGATVMMPRGERLRVVSAHLDGRSNLTRTLAGGNQARARQVSGLIDGLDRAEDDGPLAAATLLGADLGIWDDRETAMRHLEEAFPESPAWDGRNTRGPFAMDHIFFRRGVFEMITVGRYARLEERYGSSHHGRRVVLNYLPRTSPDG